MTNKPSIRKLIKKFASIFSISFIFLLFSCEGFFTNNDLDVKIKDAIAYANMSYSHCQISTDSGTGSITPLGTKEYKPTDFMNIEFVMEPAYEFINWEFIYKETVTKEGEIQKEASDPEWWKDYVKIVKQSSSEKDGKTTFYLQVQFTKGTDNLIIKPKCSKKPLVDAWEPGDSNAGVPRETQIRIKFDSELKESSFFYTAEELAQLDTDGIPPENLLKEKYNEVEKVYGYKTSYGAVFKSIKITVDGGDYTSYFVGPVLETIDAGNKKYTRVSFTPQNALPCHDDESKTAAVTVDLYNTIQNKDGASLTPTRYSYRINSKPLEYSYVDMSDYNIEEGQPNPGNARFEFAISKHIPLSYKENPSYKFLYWTTNNSNIRFADGDPTLNPTSFYSTVLIKESDKAKIKPVTVVRPKFQEADFKASYAGTNPRDTDIILTFDKDIVIPKGTKIAITCTGKGDVSTSFEAPEIVTGNNKKIQILAKQDENRIQVRSGEKLTITVTIPDTLYYVYHDALTNQDINVSLGKEIVAEYKIDETTQDKASVSFSAQLNGEACGTINVDNVKKTDDDPAIPYNIDYEAIINFKPNDNYEFLYWTASNDKIEIKDRFSASTTIIAKKSGSCTITAKCAPKLKVLSLRPNASDNKNPCDSDIWIETNIKPLYLTTTGRTSDNKKCNCVLSLSVNYNGTDVMSSHYENPEIKEEGGKVYIYLKSKKKLTVPQDTVNNVNVKIDGAFHYAYEDPDGILTDPVEINLVNGSYSGSFGVVEKTQKQIYVQLNVNPAHISLVTTPLNSYRNNSGIYVLNENTEYDLNFTAQQAYQFVKWNITGQDNDAEDAPVKIQKTTMYGVDYYKLVVGSAKEGVGTSTSPITIADDSAERIVPTLTSPENISAGVERDSGIILSFNKKPDDSIKQKIQITVDGYSVADSFDLANANFAGNTLTINPNTANRISVSAGTTRKVKVTIPADTYYTYPETTPTDNILCGKDYTFEYTINEQTNDKVKVTYKVLYNNSDTPATGTTPLTIKCNDVVVPSSQETYFMDGISRTLTIADNDDYQFLYWETNAPADFVFNSNTPKTSKTRQFTTANPNSAVTVIAYCAPRLKVIGNPEPAKQTAGVQRDSNISLTFNIKPDLSIKDKIRITADGIPANTNFKLADITDSSFTSGNKLTIQANLTKRITVSANSTKTMLVTVPADTYYQYTASDGQVYDITLGNDYSHEYTINETTIAQAKVTYKVYVGATEQSSAGTIRCNDENVTGSQFTYNMDSITRTLAFTENSDYQFLYWETTDTAAVSMTAATRENKQTTFVPAGAGNNVTIKAVCAPRLKLDHATPVSSDDGAARDSNITLWFNANPDISLLKSNISIYCGGSSVKDCFPTSGWSNLTTDNNLYKLTINASSSNRISVTTGTKPTVTVTVPAATYYNYTAPDGNSYPVTCGTNNTYEYKINASTKQQANVLFKVYDYNGTTEITGGTAGTITCDGVTPSSTGIKYDMDNIARTLNFTETEDYQFLYWTSTNSIISINSNTKENKTSSFTPVGTGTTSPSSDIIIQAVCAKRPRVTAFSPAYSEDGIEQDTNIKITFDQTPVNYSAINVYRNDVKDTTHFGTRAVSNKVLTITTSKVTAATGTGANVRFVSSGTQNVRVEVPSSLYYNCTSNGKTYPVTYGGSGRSDVYKINSSTTNKVTLKGPASTLASGQVSFSPERSDNKYSIGEVVYATFEPNTDYTFNYWSISPSLTTSSMISTASGNNPAKITVVRSSTTTTYTFTPDTDFSTKISSMSPENLNAGVPCDTPIEIRFNKEMDFSSLSKGSDIIIYDQFMNDISSYFGSPYVFIDDDNKTVVRMPINYNYSIKEIFGNNNTAIIQVHLSSDLEGVDGMYLSTSGYDTVDDYLVLPYRINKQTEDDLPSFDHTNSCYVYNIQTFTPYSAVNKFSANNHIYDHFEYQFELWDETSGIADKMDINAKVIYDVDGNPVTNGKQVSTTVDIDGADGDSFCYVEGTVDFSTDFGDDKIEEDCMIQVDFVIYDVAGNSNTLTYYIAMDRTFDMEQSFTYNRYFSTNYDLSNSSNLTTLQSYASPWCEPTPSQNGNLSWINPFGTYSFNNVSGHMGIGHTDNIALIQNTTTTYVYFRYPRGHKFIKFNGTEYTDSITYATIDYGTDYDKVARGKTYWTQGQIFTKSGTVESYSVTTSLNTYTLDAYDYDYEFVIFQISASKTDHTYIRIGIRDESGHFYYTDVMIIPRCPEVSLYYYPGQEPYTSSYAPYTSINLANYLSGANKPSDVPENVDGQSYPLYEYKNVTKGKRGFSSSGAISKLSNDNELVNDAADFIFSSRYVLGKTSGGKITFKADLRSPASDTFSYAEDTNYLPDITGISDVTFTSKGPNTGMVDVKFKINNYSSYPSGTKFIDSNDKTSYTMSSAGYITLTNQSSHIYMKNLRLSYGTRKAKTQEIRFTNPGIDNMAPDITYIGPERLVDGYVNVYPVSDEDSSLVITTHNGQQCYEYEYVIIPDNQSFNKSQFDNYNPIKAWVPVIKVTTGHSWIDIDHCFPRYPLPKDCTVYLRVKDSLGNYNISDGISYNHVLNKKQITNDMPQLTVTKDTNTKVKLTTKYNSSYLASNASGNNYYRRCYFDFEKFNSTYKMWEYPYYYDFFEDQYCYLYLDRGKQNAWYDDTGYDPPNSNYGTYNSGKGDTDNPLYIDISSTANNTSLEKTETVTANSFYRFMVEYRGGGKASVPVYYYTGTATCNLKNIIEGSKTSSLLCDKPTIYYCCYSFDDYGDNMDEWEVYAAHTETGYTSTSTNIDTSAIPPGMNYVIIAHFADNTSAMSTVMTKQ